MRIALFGYGKMGKEIERIALEKGYNVVLKIDIDTPPFTPEQQKNTDVLIHFANAKTLIEDIKPWIEKNIPVVIGTTGWLNDLLKVKELAEKNNAGIIYGSNFSLGVNIFFSLAKKASQIINNFTDYDAYITELHHNKKLDSPSGTALTIGKLVLSELKRKKELLTETSHGQIKPEQLHIASIRSGTIVGTHSLVFDSAADSIEINHIAKNRSGLALGSLLAAKWIIGKKGFFTIEDVFQDIFK